jgi:hypothetical protein
MAGTLELGADGYQVIYSERASDNYISMTPEQYDRYKNESGKNIGDFRGKISCRQDIVSAPVMVELQDQGYLCTTGGDVCIQSQYFDWREMRLSCEEINPDYPDEYRGFAYFGNPACQNEGLIGVINSLLTPDQKAKFLASCNDADLDFYRLTSGTVIFIPDKEGNAGPHGFRCGKYYNLSPEAVPDPNWCGGGETGCPPQAENHYTAPWLGFAGGNVYAQAGIKMAATDSHINNQAGGDGHQNYVVDNLSDSGNVCSRTAGKRAGLLATGINGEIAITDGFLTHRGTYGGVENKVSAEKAFPSLERRDFHYYKAQVNYESVSVCPNYSVISDSKVCKIVVGGKRTDLTLPSDIASDDKIVIFLEFTDEVKELEINSGLAAKLRAPTNGYLALITNGLVTIGSTVGTYLSDGACRTVTNKSADLQLVLIANELKFSDYGRYEPDPFFNPKRYCDLQLTMAGNFVTWKGNIAFNRELSGCGILRAEQESQGLQTSSTNGEQYRDAYLNLSYNSASTLVFPRSDLIERTPEWMREAKSLRMTTQ